MQLDSIYIKIALFQQLKERSRVGLYVLVKANSCNI